jgi:predicted RNase H-like HicB family nuclease
MAQEALEFHVKSMREDGEELPEPKTLKEVRQKYYENVLIYQSIFIK